MGLGKSDIFLGNMKLTINGSYAVYMRNDSGKDYPLAVFLCYEDAEHFRSQNPCDRYIARLSDEQLPIVVQDILED